MTYRLCELLRDWRIAAGFTQTKVAEEIGIRQTTLSKWEVGARQPSVDDVAALARLYRVQPIQFGERLLQLRPAA